MKFFKILFLIFFIFLLSLSDVSAHGADITEDVMVIADESTGYLTKSLVDEKKYNIAVYKFKSDHDVIHQLEHALSNPNKKILVVSYQNTSEEFLKKNSNLSKRIIIVNSDKESISKGLDELKSMSDSNSSNINDNIDYMSIFLVIVIVGLVTGLGTFLIRKK